MLRAYPSLFLLMAIVPGIVFADQLRLPVWVYLSIAAIAALLGIIWLLRKKSTHAAVALGLALLCFSAFHYSLRYYPTGAGHVANYADGEQRYHIYGQVSDWPKLRTDRTELKVRVDSLVADGVYPVHGTVLVRLEDTTTCLQRGDRLEFLGRIYPLRGSVSPGGFDYRRYLNLKGIHGIVYMTTLLDLRLDKRNRYGLFNMADGVRGGIVDALNRNLSPRAAALAAGFLIGETRNIPVEVYGWFRDSGTLHLLAVSGSNVALVLGFFIFLIRPLSLSRRVRTIILLAVLVLFTLISYGEPSVVRASVMATLVLLSRLVQRRTDLNNIISAAAAIILLFDPTQLFDVGFQLSFVTAWGLIFVTPAVLKIFRMDRRRWWYYCVVVPLAIAIVAQVCSAPLIAFYFQRLPVLSVVANVLIVVLTSGAVLGILGVLMADFILPALGAFTGSLVNLLMELILRCLQFFGGENAPVIQIDSVPAGVVIACYIYLVLGVWALKSRRIRRFVVISLVVLTNLALLRPAALINETDHTNIWLTTVPGGIAAVVRQGEQPYGDLIITGMLERDYPIDDRILVPMLERFDIKALHSIFVLSADYGAIDDLVRVGNRLAAETVIVPKRLEFSFRDIIRQPVEESGAMEIVVSPKHPASRVGIGFYPFRDGLVWTGDKSCLLLVDNIDSDFLPDAGLGGIDRLVVGRRISDLQLLLPWIDTLGLSSIILRSLSDPDIDQVFTQEISNEIDSLTITHLDRVGIVHLRFAQ
ncbi:MAG: ComEC family competence protein [candidate division Zixibacteria bacterium]|nr:ComEC family competence protein [candidate division Zixibacteria bacterium]